TSDLRVISTTLSTTELPRRDTVARSPGRCQPVNESHESSASSCRCAGFEPETSEACAPLRRSAKLSYSGGRGDPCQDYRRSVSGRASTSDLADVVSTRKPLRVRDGLGEDPASPRLMSSAVAPRTPADNRCIVSPHGLEPRTSRFSVGRSAI